MMNRRAFMGGLAALAALSGQSWGTGPAHQDLDRVVKTASDCVAAGQACIRHCQTQMAAGNVKQFERCLRAAQQMTSICRSMGELAAQRAPMAKRFASICVDACEECRQACLEHEEHFHHHQECQACMESCTTCRDACKKLTA